MDSTSTQTRFGSKTSGEFPPIKYSRADVHGAFAATAHVGTTTRPSGTGLGCERNAARSVCSVSFCLESSFSLSVAPADESSELTVASSVLITTLPLPFRRKPPRARSWSTYRAPSESETSSRPVRGSFPSSRSSSSKASTSLPSVSPIISSSRALSNLSIHISLYAASSNSDSVVRNVTPVVARHSPHAISSSPRVLVSINSRGNASLNSRVEASLASSIPSPAVLSLPSTLLALPSAPLSLVSTSISNPTALQFRFEPGTASISTNTRIRRLGSSFFANRSSHSAKVSSP
mmetsp:Transcript_4041/g.14849  ORF Transcript_4041/g.14849 Transcript_4041/m.14849 type:complete len:292 (-) Transcript_4041:239-1114(-)